MTLHAPLLRAGYAVAALTATTFVTAACGADRLPVASRSAPAALTAVAGDGQTGAVAQALPVPLAVRVADAAGHALSGVAVRWAASSGGPGAALSASDSVTNAQGRESATWTLGHTAGSDTATAVVTGVAPVRFVATAVSGPAASVAAVAGDSQSAAPGSSVGTPPQVVVKDAYDNPKPGVTVTFAVTTGGGSVTGATQTTDSAGLATVGGWTLGNAGTNTLTATVAGSGVRGNPLTFVATAATSTATVLFSENFDDPDLASRGWYDLASGATAYIDSTQHIPGSAASLALTFDSGGTVPATLVRARHLFTPTDAVYLRYWVKYSANWVGSAHTYHPHEFYFMTTENDAYVGPAYTHLTTYVEDNYQNGGYAVLAAQDGENIDTLQLNVNLTNITENRAACGCNGNSDNAPFEECYLEGLLHYNDKRWLSASPVFLPNPGTGYKGDWHEVEAYFKLNSIQNGIGQLDGVAQYWIDGQLVTDRHGVLFRTGVHPTMQFNQLMIGFYIGDGSPVTQTVWVDNLEVATGRP